MAAARREDRRALALDVWRLFVDKKFEVDRFLRTGAIDVYQRYPLPDNPLIHQEIERILKERSERASNGKQR